MRLKSTNMDTMVRDAVFGANNIKSKCRSQIFNMAHEEGIFPASIYPLYKAIGEGLHSEFTVPAINIRGITYEVARTVLRAALTNKARALIFEISRGEMEYTEQTPGEYAACIMAAAIREQFIGPIFLQGDHYQVNQDLYTSDREKELNTIKELIVESVAAGFFNIDVDASTLVDINKKNLYDQQTVNCAITADLTKFIREIQPEGITISIGGEIGEVGGRNSTVADLEAFMNGYRKLLVPGMTGISKISVQTGTTHGGVILPDGSIANVEIDFKTLKNLSQTARKQFRLGGAVQHGASTLPDEAFDYFPQSDTLEVHLATGFQNIIFDHELFPEELQEIIHAHLMKKYASEMKAGDTLEQFYYKTRKKAFGDFKQEMWNIPVKNIKRISEALEERFSVLFRKLKVVNTEELVRHYIKR